MSPGTDGPGGVPPEIYGIPAFPRRCARGWPGTGEVADCVGGTTVGSFRGERRSDSPRRPGPGLSPGRSPRKYPLGHPPDLRVIGGMSGLESILTPGRNMMKRALMDRRLFLALLLLTSSLFCAWGCGKDLEEVDPEVRILV